MAENGAEDVGAGFVVTYAESISDFFRNQRLHRAELLDEFGENGGAGGGYEFMGFVALGKRDAAVGKDRDGRGCGNWKASVGTVNPAGAFHDGRGEHARFSEQFEADRGTHDIDDGINRADFVKVNAELKLGALTSIRFVFDRAEAWTVLIDDIGFAKLSRPSPASTCDHASC